MPVDPDLLAIMGMPALTPSERKRMLKTRKKGWGGYAAMPGSGPQGETCGSCKHLARRRFSKTFLKCGLMERCWTNGAGTDIKARSPACKRWEKGE